LWFRDDEGCIPPFLETPLTTKCIPNNQRDESSEHHNPEQGPVDVLISLVDREYQNEQYPRDDLGDYSIYPAPHEDVG
jgi:hypothetical protein